MPSNLRCALLLLAYTLSASAQQPEIPDTPAGKLFSAFLDAFNSADRTKLDTYVKTYAPNDDAADLLNFEGQTGGFTLLAIEHSAPGAISFRVKGRTDHLEGLGLFKLASTTPPKLQSWTIRLTRPGAVLDDIVLDHAVRQRTIDAIKTQLTEYYIYPDIAQKMGQTLDQHQQHGDYDKLADGSAFAEALQRDLRAVNNDRHLHVEYDPFKLPPGAPHDDDAPRPPSPEDLARFRTQLEHENCSFSKVEILPGNIAYLKFNQFAPPDFCGATATAAMGFLAHTSALIVDLRDNGGGDPHMVQYLVSYLFDHSVHINDLYNRHDDSTTQYWTLPYLPGPRLAQPVYVLTSHHTFSGAEEFTYDLQTQKRATIIGENTGGGAHPVNGMPAGDHFTIGVPLMRPINPVTKKDWEGTGITPDISVPADQALATAQKVATDRMQHK